MPLQWADEVEEGDSTVLPPRSEKVEGGKKIVTDYRFNDDGKRVRTVKTYKLEEKKLKASVARRKNLAKFGKVAGDLGEASTIVAEEVFMQFMMGEDAEEQEDDDPLNKLKNQKSLVKCRHCKEDHWTSQCPYKDHLVDLKRAGTGLEEKKEEVDPNRVAVAAKGKYVPPSFRDGTRRPGETMSSRKEDFPTIRISNISENCRESDLEELCKPFGKIQKIYLAKDKVTGVPKGFAFIHFQERESADKAIRHLNKFRYDYLVLNCEWAK